MSTLPTQDLVVHQNTTLSILAKMNTPQGEWAQWSLRSQVRSEADTGLVAEFEITPTSEGWLFELSDKVTSQLKPGLYFYDVLGQFGSRTYLVAEGALEIVPTITELP